MGQQDLQQGTAGEGDNLDAAVRQMRELVDGEFGVGTLAALGNGWQSVFLGHSATREQDLEILAARLRWRPRGPDARTKLRDRADMHGRALREERVYLAKLGLCEVAGDLSRPQTIRLAPRDQIPERHEEWSRDQHGPIAPIPMDGFVSMLVAQGPGRWVRGADGREVVLTPRNLSQTARFFWYVASAKAAANAALHDEAWPSWRPPRPDDVAELISLEEVSLPSFNASDVEDAILSRIELESLVTQAGLSPAEQELVEAYLETRDWCEAGQSLDLTPLAARQRKRRAMEKLKAQGRARGHVS